MRRLHVGVTIILLSMLVMIVTGVLMSMINIPSSGFIVSVGIRVTDTDNIQITELNWGELYQSSQVSRTIRVHNIGNKNVTITMTTSGMPSYLSLAWNREGAIIAPGGYIDATFTLTVSPTPEPGTFRFDIVITGTEIP